MKLLAELPLGDGPKRAHIRMRQGLSRIARRVATKALVERREDIFLEVYAAGICHATALYEDAKTGGVATAQPPSDGQI